MRLVALGMGCPFLAWVMLFSPQPVHAQTTTDPYGLVAGTIMVRGRIVAILPDNNDTAITGIGGHIKVSNSITPEIDLSYFLTDHIAFEGEAGVTYNSLTAENTISGTVRVGKVWGAPVLVLLQYHFLPKGRWNPYAGAGLAVLPYFDPQAAGGSVQQLSVRSEVGAAFQAGLDLHITDHWYGNLDIKKLLVSSYASVNDGTITAAGHVSPIIVGLGIGYRF